MGKRVLVGWLALGCGGTAPAPEAERAPVVAAERRGGALSIGAYAKSVASTRPPWKIADATGVTVSGVRAAWTGDGELRIDATARFDAAPKQASSVWVKASCRNGDHVLVDVDEARDEDWVLYELDAERMGEDIAIHQELFGDDRIEADFPCQLEFRVVPVHKGPMYRIQPRYCLTRPGVSAGDCEGLIDPPRGTDPRYTATHWELDRTVISYIVTAGERFSRYAQIGVRADCSGEIHMSSATTRWQWLDPGESRLERFPATFYQPCALTAERWRRDPDSYALTGRVALGEACLESGSLKDGPCTPARRPESPAPGPGPTFATELHWVGMKNSHGFANVRLTLDVDAIRPPTGEKDLSGTMECTTKEGIQKTTLAATGLDVRHLRVGDTARRSFSSYVFADTKHCELVVNHGSVELGRWCVDKAGERPCR